MKRIEFQERIDGLLARYTNAKRHKCERTARARARDMAKLYAEYSGRSYSDSLAHIEDLLR